MNQLLGHLFASPKKSICYDAVKIMEPKLNDNQCSFCHGCSTTKEISTSQQVSKNSCEHAKDLYKCFVDLGKVYGGVSREKLWVMLWECGVDRCLLLAVK